MGTAEWYEDLLSRWHGGLPITEEEWLAHFDHQNQGAVGGIGRDARNGWQQLTCECGVGDRR